MKLGANKGVGLVVVGLTRAAHRMQRVDGHAYAQPADHRNVGRRAKFRSIRTNAAWDGVEPARRHP
jgi:hypothetical protein